MSLILWLLQIHWNHAVENWTYKNFWSIERIAKFFYGAFHLICLPLMIFHSIYWLIPLCMANLVALTTAVLGKSILHGFLDKLGFKEQWEILEFIKASEKADTESVLHSYSVTISDAKVHAYFAVGTFSANTLTYEEEVLENQFISNSAYWVESCSS